MLRRLYLLPIALLLSACDRGSVEAEAKVSARVTTEPASAALPGKTEKPTDSDAPAAAPSANAGPTEPASAVPPSDVPASGLPSSDGLPPTDAPRVHAKSRNVWIRSGPASDNQWIGMLWFGGSVKIRDEQRLAGAGCATPWVPVEPRGWVCVDGERATTDARDPVLLSLYPFRPRVETAFPHRYAEVHEPTRRYERMPDEALQRAWELNFDRHQSAVLAARAAKSVPAELGPIDVTLTGRLAPELPPLPSGLSEKRDRIAPRSALAFVDAFDSGGRAFLLAADLSWVPRDRVETLPHYAFQGVVVDSANPWPLAFFRGRQRPAFERGADGRLVESSRRFERLDHVSLAGEELEQDGVRYYRVRDSQLWISSKEAVVPRPEKTPWGALVGTKDETGLAPAGRATWIEVSVLGGWLVAFEGTRPVYATMISAGRGGTPQGDKDPVSTASTPTGRFSITGKFKTATMESSTGPIVHGDVPWTQNFSGPHAIHSAYWHDDWGNLKSAGCVNVSPRDGKWLFEFSEPEVPEGWHGVRHVARYGPSTRVVIHE